MTTNSTEPSSFRDFEQTGWQAAAGSYHDYWETLTRQAIDPLLDALAITTGSELLDIACGPGYVAGAAAKRGARATGIDFSGAMVNTATRLNPGIEFHEGDAENLPFAANTFSAVAINFGMLHFSNPERALSEAHRVLKSGGRIAFTVWATPQEAKGFAAVMAAVEAHGTLQVPIPPGPPFFRFSDASEATRVLREAGFVDATATPVKQLWRFNAPEDFFTAVYNGTVRTRSLIHRQSAPAREAIRSAIIETAKSYAHAGRIEIPMPAVLSTARKP